MRTLVAWSIFCALVATLPAQSSGTPLCDAVVDTLRNNSEVMSGRTDAWSALTGGNQPFIATGTPDPMETQPAADQDDNARRLQRFRETFNPSEALGKQVGRYMGDEHTEVQTLKDSSLHTIWSIGGTAHCSSFLFFQTFPGKTSELVADVPPESDRDGDNVICEEYGSSGYLARVNGAEAFVRVRAGNFRVVPFENGKWTQACAVEVKYRDVNGVRGPVESLRAMLSR